MIRKTIYFPREKSGGEKSERISISISSSEDIELDAEFLTFCQKLTSRSLRESIGNPNLTDLLDDAKNERRTLSSLIQFRLHRYYTRVTGKLESEPGVVGKKEKIGVTFRDNLELPIHRWYPFVEGLDAEYTRAKITEYSPKVVLDPFGGSGTTQLVASTLEIDSFYCEINPFMQFVSNTKINSSKWASENLGEFDKIVNSFFEAIDHESFVERKKKISLEQYNSTFPNRDFFEETHLRELLACKEIASEVAGNCQDALNLLHLACASNVVKCSNMTRRADLRRRRENEYKNRVVNVKEFIRESVEKMVIDVEVLSKSVVETQFISDNSRNLSSQYVNSVDMVLTSPPYLNGTNYFRNTKLELWFMGMIKSENDLKKFRKAAVCGGINNVTGRNNATEASDKVNDLVVKLEEVSRDKRIPKMVQHYFSDMYEVISNLYSVVRGGGVVILDIGDSKFYGVHVPTDQLLIDIALKIGFYLEERNILAKRYSKDKSELVQVELVLRKPSQLESKIEETNFGSLSLKERIEQFQKELPYKHGEYAKRNWGNALHSLCSYQGKLKPSQAHWLIRYFVPKNGRVIDPLGGVGTIPFEAALQGYDAVSNDKSPFASIIGAAKMNPPTEAEALAALEVISLEIGKISLDKSDYADAEFGLNGKVSEFYHQDTLEEVLKARKLLLQRKKPLPKSEALVWASILHILHGNRPYALSRNSHPITPYYPKGDFEYRSLIKKTKERIQRMYKQDLPSSLKRGIGINGDFRELDVTEIGEFDTMITSPPFMGMRFDRPNWLRMWFCGWLEKDFHETSLGYLERQQTTDRDCYEDFFTKAVELLKPDGVLIMHIGSGKKKQLLEDLIEIGQKYFQLRGEISEDVQALPKHGIPDKGKTKSHHLIFFENSRK
jgi:DNA modification methylase